MSTLFTKIWHAHSVVGNLIAIDRVFLHERTGAAALKSMAAAGRPIVDPARVFAVMDHIVDTRPGRGDQTLMPGGQAFISETREAARAAGITLFDVTDRDQGIVHVVSPELGIVLPGITLVAPDSHGRNELGLDLQRAVDRLPPRARAVLVLHDVEGWRHEDIAAELGMAVGTSKAQLHRARGLLRRMLGAAA